MKKRLLNRKRLMQNALSLCLILVSSFTSWGQQVIGQFPTMDGGFEAQGIGNLTTIQAGLTPITSGSWTTSTGNATVVSASCKNDTPRTGGKYVTFLPSGSNRRLNSPTAAAGAVNQSGTYTIQYYYRTGATAPSATMSYGVFYSDLNLAANTWGTYPTIIYPEPAYTLYAPVISASVSGWTKMSVTITNPMGASSTIPKNGFFSPFKSGAGGAIDIDDAVMYAGALDVAAPSNPSGAVASSILATQQNISWTAASGGVDGGGYMVVRGIADPATPLQANGIYAVGNTVAPGETVVYLGTGTSFIDTGLTANTPYYYRIYTVDKAFNYSSALTFTSTTGASITLEPEPTVQTSGLSFSNVTGTGFDISWTAGNGSKSLVVVKPVSNVDSDPIDGGIYVPSATFGGGTQIGSGNYVVYNGNGNSASITGLSLNTIYYVKVYSFNVNAQGSENYLITDPASGNQKALPYQNTFTFDSTTEGFTVLTRAVAILATDSSRATLKINSTVPNVLNTKVGLSSSYARVNGTTNKYAHITLKNATTNNNIQLVSSATTFDPLQIITINDADYKTYDFDLSTLTGDQYPEINISVKGTWAASGVYAINDQVISSNSTYKNISGLNTANAPRADIIANAAAVPPLPQNWEIVGAEGALLNLTGFVYVDSIVFDNIAPVTPTVNVFNFVSTTEGFDKTTRATAVQETESSKGTLKINCTTAAATNAKVALSSLVANVEGANKYAHITLKNTSTNTLFQLNGKVAGVGTAFNPIQTYTKEDTDYKTYDFDLSTWDSGSQFPELNFAVKDTWSATGVYITNDQVISSNSTYKNVTGINTANSPRADIIANAAAVPPLTQNWELVGTEGALLDLTRFIYIDSIVFDNVDLGTNDFKQGNNTISLYPNPTQEVLNVSSSNKISKIEVYDLLGRKVASKNNASEVNVAALGKGVYIVKVVQENGSVIAKRFIKE
jgi:hypothetical protein